MTKVHLHQCKVSRQSISIEYKIDSNTVIPRGIRPDKTYGYHVAFWQKYIRTVEKVSIISFTSFRQQTRL